MSEVRDPNRRTPDGGDRRRTEQQQFDTSHDSDTRGEHRYDDAHQTPEEQQDRRDRDDLKRRLERPGTRLP